MPLPICYAGKSKHLYSLMRFIPRLQAILNKPFRLWLLLWTSVMLLYIPAWKGGFQQDFHGWLLMYTDLPFRDILNREGAGVHSFYQLTQLQLYFWTWLFGTHQLPWFLLFTALFSLNGFLLLRLCLHIFKDFRLPFAAWTAVAGTLFFLFNPGMTEAVVWKASYHYHIALQIVLWVLLWMRRYLHGGSARWAWLAIGLFLLSTLTLEVWYTIPWFVLVLGAAYLRGGLILQKAFVRLLRNVFLPMLGIFAAYLLLYHRRYGVWLAHGAYEASGEADIPKLAGRIWSYEAHLLLGGRFWPHEARQVLYHHVAEGSIGWIMIILLLVSFAVYAFVRFPRASPRLKGAALLGAWSLMALIVVLHFGPDELFWVCNDRYLYVTAAFQGMLIAVLTGALLPLRKRLWAGISLFLLLANISGTAFLVWQWRKATKAFWGIQYNYRWQDAPLVLLLNIPCNYNGIGIIHANRFTELGEHLRIFYKRAPKGKVVDVAAYNMRRDYDGAHVRMLDSMHVKVTLNAWGCWWWYFGQGLREYSNEYYDLKFDSDGLSYILTLKQRQPGMVLLYSQGMQWREVDMARRDEQW